MKLLEADAERGECVNALFDVREHGVVGAGGSPDALVAAKGGPLVASTIVAGYDEFDFKAYQ